MEEEESDKFLNVACVLICIASGASAAGLTMGLLSLDSLKLKIKLVTGDDQEKADVAKLLPVLEDHHLLLCTLLIFNAVANEAMPIFLDALVPSWAAVLVSVTLVLVFGEVVPTALFTGPQQLRIVSTFVPLVYTLQTMFYPVAKPMALALDYFLGHDEDDEGYSREELSAMVRILRSKGADVGSSGHEDSSVTTTTTPRSSQNNTSSALVEEEERVGDSDSDNSSDEEPLTANEVDVITGVLSLSKMTMLDLLTPLDQVNMVSQSQVFGAESISALLKAGHSRLPVFKDTNRKNIVGVFRIKALVGVDPDDAVTMDKLGQSFQLKRPLVVGAGQTPLNALNLFQQGQSHIALVSHDPAALLETMVKGIAPPSSCEPIGIVTLEDVIEAMIQSQIYDEEDQVEEVDKGAKVRNEDLFALAMTAASGATRLHESIRRPQMTKSVSTGDTRPSKQPMTLKSGESTGLLSSSADADADGVELGAGSGKYSSYRSISAKSENEATSPSLRIDNHTASASFYRKFGGMFDNMGVLLIPPQDGAHKTQLAVASREGGGKRTTSTANPLTQALGPDNRIRPSMVSKYAKRWKQTVDKGKDRKKGGKKKEGEVRSRSVSEMGRGSGSAKLKAPVPERHSINH